MIMGDFVIAEGEMEYEELQGRIFALEELVDELATENEVLNGKLEIYEKFFNAVLGLEV